MILPIKIEKRFRSLHFFTRALKFKKRFRKLRKKAKSFSENYPKGINSTLKKIVNKAVDNLWKGCDQESIFRLKTAFRISKARWDF
jgi:hypothetical protein